MRIGPVPPALSEQGICAQKGGPDFFSADPLDVRQAKNICSGCPVRFLCMQWAVSVPELFGVWGGADQWEIRIACAVDVNGDPVKRSRPAKCPYCRSAKNVEEKREETSRASQANCLTCGLTWRRARSHVKKPRKSLPEAA